MSRGRAPALCLVACLAAVQGAPAVAQPQTDGARPGNEIGTGMSLPRSDAASNLDSATTHSELAPRLPAPPAGEDVQSLLLAARAALTAGRTGEAQEAVERAETRALDRSIPAGTQNVPADDALVAATRRIRMLLAAGNVPGTVAAIDAALPAAADASLPR